MCLLGSDDVNYHDVYFDHFFTSLPLLEDLRKQGIRGTGTLRANKLLGAPLPPPKEMQKKERGTIEVCSAEAVILASNHQTHEPLNTYKWYNRTKKESTTRCKLTISYS